MSRPVEFADPLDTVERYRSGVSVKQLANENGCGRGAVERLLRLHGVSVRGRSEAERLKWAHIKTDRALLERQCSAAWAAARARDDVLERKVVALYRRTLMSQREIAELLGSSVANIRRILKGNALAGDRLAERRAFGKEGLQNSGTGGKFEQELLIAMRALGGEVEYKMRLGPRNVDFAFPQSRVAVEIVRRHRGDSKTISRERLKDIGREPWRLLIVYDPSHDGIDVPAVAQYCVAFADLMRRQPPACRQYWVIGGNAKPVPRSGLHLYGWTRVVAAQADLEITPNLGVR